MSDKHFNIKIAGTIVEIISNHDCIHEFCSDYLTGQAPDLTIHISQEDIAYERERDDKSSGSGQGRIPSDYPDSYLEVLACYRKIAEKMLDRNILLMHGAAISIDDHGVMFIAGSGTGKSTHAGIWKKHFGNRVDIINDDKPLVKITKDKIFVCGTPWSGKKGLNTPVDVPLKTIYKIERTTDRNPDTTTKPLVKKGHNYVFELDNDEKLAALISQSYKSTDPVRLAKSLELTDKILKLVPVKKLVCDMSDDAARTAYEGVFGGSIS